MIKKKIPMHISNRTLIRFNEKEFFAYDLTGQKILVSQSCARGQYVLRILQESLTGTCRSCILVYSRMD